MPHPGGLAGRRTLVVDDNATNREILGHHVVAGGMHGETAADGMQALESRVVGSERERLEHFGRWAVARILEQQRRALRDYGVEYDVWTSEQRAVR